MIEQPKIIILDNKKEIAEFEKNMAPLLRGVDISAKELFDIVWPGFHDYAELYNYVFAGLEHAVEALDLTDTQTDVSDKVYAELQSFAERVAWRLNSNTLYGDTGYLPYHWEWHPQVGAYLRKDLGLMDLYRDTDE